MSSSGKGQSTVDGPAELAAAWDYARRGGRVDQGRVIVEAMVDFDYEITLLTVRAVGESGEVETAFCAPIGHRQERGRLCRKLAAAADERERAGPGPGDCRRDH